jgi:hypothetical protein
VSEFEERCASPGVEYPVWGFEVLLAAEGAESFEVLRFEGEGVGELVAVDEEGGGEGEVSVKSARRLGWGEGLCRECEVEFGMEACWVLERGCDRELGEGGWERVVARGKREHRRAWMIIVSFESTLRKLLRRSDNILGLSCSPSTARYPPTANSSTSSAFSPVNTPTSTLCPSLNFTTARSVIPDPGLCPLASTSALHTALKLTAWLIAS